MFKNGKEMNTAVTIVIADGVTASLKKDMPSRLIVQSAFSKSKQCDDKTRQNFANYKKLRSELS